MTDNTPAAPAVLTVRIAEMHEATGLRKECLERATYLLAMKDEGQSTIMRQSMDTLFKAADALNTRPTAVLPSEDEVARVANAIANADLDGPDPDDYWHWLASAAIAAMAPEQIAGTAPFNAAIDAVAAAEGALCRARERADAGDHASIDAELANLRRARGAIHEARSEQEPQ